MNVIHLKAVNIGKSGKTLLAFVFNTFNCFWFFDWHTYTHTKDRIENLCQILAGAGCCVLGQVCFVYLVPNVCVWEIGFSHSECIVWL